MHNIDFTLLNGNMVLNGYPEGSEVLEIKYEKKYKMLYSYLLHRADLLKANEYFSSYIEITETKSPANEAIINAALITLIKCFTSSADRAQLNKDAVFKNKPEAIEVFDYFKRLRDKFVVHDESELSESKVGIIVNKSDKTVLEAFGFCAFAALTDKDHVCQLHNLINATYEYVEQKIEEECTRIVDDYKAKAWEEVEKLPNMVYAVNTDINKSKKKSS